MKKPFKKISVTPNEVVKEVISHVADQNPNPRPRGLKTYWGHEPVAQDLDRKENGGREIAA